MTSRDDGTRDAHLADEIVDPAAAIVRLERCLEALTATGTEQQPLFPEDESAPETLAAEFDRALSMVQRIAANALTPEQSDALSRVSEKLLLISRDGDEFDADLWTEGAVQTSTHWREVRALAAAALAVM
jgi:hypothetical protein